MLKRKEYKNLIKKALFFLSGMFIPIVIFGVYLWINNALGDFVDAYILYNVKNYTFDLEKPFYLKIILSVLLFITQLSINIVMMLLIIMGLTNYLHKNEILEQKTNKVLMHITFVLSFLGIYYNGLSYEYYFLFMSPYIIFGLIMIYDKLVRRITTKKYRVSLLISIIISVVFLLSSDNLSFMKIQKEDLVQYKFAKIINQKKDATMLNCDFLDGGFYMMANILPNTRYFERQNGYMTDYEQEIKKEIDNSKFDYIVFGLYDFEEVPEFVEEKYELIAKEKQIFECDYTFSLYKSKS